MPAVTTQLNDFILPASAKPRAESPPAASLWARLRDAFYDAQMRRAEREIAHLIEARGGRITDDLERHIQRRFL